MYLIIMNVIISDYVRNFANAPTSPIDGEAMCHLLQAKLWFLKCSLFCECATNQGAVSIRKTVFPGMAIPMLKIRRPSGRLIFNMEIAIRR